MGSLNTRGILTLNDETFEGRIVTHHGRLRIFKVKDTIFDQQVTTLDRLSRKTWSVTFEGGQIGQIQGTGGCGCGGGR